MGKIISKSISFGDTFINTSIFGEGSPACLVIPDWGSNTAEWQPAGEHLGQFAGICVMDRPGYGGSPESNLTRNAENIRAEILAVMDSISPDEPVILAGHGAGGLYARLAAAAQPDRVRGVVFIDSYTEGFEEYNFLNTPEFMQFASVEAKVNWLQQMLGLDREIHKKMVAPMIEMLYPHFPAELKSRLVDFATKKEALHTFSFEYRERETVFSDLRAATFPQVPVRVIMRDPKMMMIVNSQYTVPEKESKVIEELWLKHSFDLLSLGSGSALIEAQGCAHDIHLCKPEYIGKALREI